MADGLLCVLRGFKSEKLIQGSVITIIDWREREREREMIYINVESWDQLSLLKEKGMADSNSLLHLSDHDCLPADEVGSLNRRTTTVFSILPVNTVHTVKLASPDCNSSTMANSV